MTSARRITWKSGRFTSTSGTINGVELFRTHYSSDRSDGPDKKYKLTHKIPIQYGQEWSYPTQEAAQLAAEDILVQMMSHLGFGPIDQNQS